MHPSPQDQRDPPSRPSTKPISCKSCRHRKIKCNKVFPCEPCRRSGRECIPISRRARAPRKNQKLLESRDAELLRRIKRLESLVRKDETATLEMDGWEQGSKSDEPALSTSSMSPLPDQSSDGNRQKEVKLDDHYASFVKQQESRNRRLGDTFMLSLGHEFDSLRQLIEQPVESEDEDSDDFMSNSTGITEASPQYLLQETDSFVDLKTAYPSEAHRSVLFDIYFENVHPLCRILHGPTATALLSSSDELFDPNTGRLKFRSLEAVTFAIFLAAVTSMPSIDCMARFGQERNQLLAQYKQSTEIALAQADYLNSMEIVTLQAFVLYIATTSSIGYTRSSWSLVGLAVRIAHGLRLHRDGDGRGFSAFEAEMRRRLWWQIVVLDMRASEDRGSEPAIVEGSFTTYLPCNINDEDFQHSSQHPLTSKEGITGMTFSMMIMDVTAAARKLNTLSSPNDSPNMTIQRKEELVKECAHRIDAQYLAGSDSSDEKTWLFRATGRILLLKLWLVTQYPLRSRNLATQDRPRGKSLETVVSYLKIAETIQESNLATGFAWYFTTYVPWHALALALAQLCTDTKGPLVDQAWSLIERGYKNWDERVCQTKDDTIWRVVKRLLKKARAARQGYLTSIEAHNSLNTIVSQSGTMPLPSQPSFSPQQLNMHPEFGNTNLQFPVDGSLGTTGFADINASQTMDPTFNIDLFGPLDVNLIDQSSPSAAFNWDNWNEFIADMGAYSAEVPMDMSQDWSMQL
ncbi:MAG: hypothetical protein Q9167_005486 [Letrouitia subvulpina]